MNTLIIMSNGQGEDELIIPVIFSLVFCLAIAVFCFYVSQFEWAMWFWEPFAIIYSFL